jgi:hypothetical protein
MDIETPSLLFQEIHSNFDARKKDQLPVDEAIISQHNTRSSSHQQAPLNLEVNWSDSTPAYVDSSKSACQSNDNPPELAIPGTYHIIILVYLIL